MEGAYGFSIAQVADLPLPSPLPPLRKREVIR